MKRITTLILSALLVLQTVPASVYAEEPVPDEDIQETIEEGAEEPEAPSFDFAEDEAEEETPETVETPAEEEPAEELSEEIPEQEEPVVEETAEPADEETAEPAEEIAEEEQEEELPETAEDVETNWASADADSPVGATVSVSSSRITVHINRVGAGGKAQLYMYDPEDYFATDTYTGLSKNVGAEGIYLGTYECTKTQDFEFNRYRADGTDNLFKKYYLIQDNQILCGPFYATEIDSMRSIPSFVEKSKKGLIHEDNTTFELAKEMGISNTVINLDLAEMVLANEDANGKPIDNSKRGDTYQFECDGETFYFKADYVKLTDTEVVTYTQMGVNITMTVISWENMVDWTTFPESMAYCRGNHQTMAFNTSNERGRKYFQAAMQFIADRYSRSSKYGLVNKYIINNEIDYTYDWSLILPEFDENGRYTRADFDVFMEEYARGFRIANMAVKKYNDQAKVVISLTHNWADARADSYDYPLDNTNRRYNSYSPKKILDWMNTVEKSRGDYDWAVAVHPYPIGTTSSNPLITDITRTDGTKPVTGDWRTSTWITAVNLELYQQYFEQPVAMYNNKELREVVLTETSVCNENENNVSEEVYRRSTYEQAATIAMYYYRAVNLDCITQIAYFQPTDQPVYKLGLTQEDGTKKPSYDIWKYIDTNLSFSYANRYLKYIGTGDAKSYYDLMDATHSGFDWKTHWNEDNIIRRIISDSTVERTLETDRTSYSSNASIQVTATGAVGDWVGLFKASDDLNSAEPIYRYPVVGTQDGFKFKSGRTYDLIAFGTVSASRSAQANLRAGQYIVALYRADTAEFITKKISITTNYTYGSTDLAISTSKSSYAVGEPIVVSAFGNTACWAGLYNVNDKYGPGNRTSIYWYYINQPENGVISGKPTIIQTKIHNGDSSNPGTTVRPGDYVIYLFDGSTGNDYNAVREVRITVEPGETLKPLESINYTLSNDTDGFANGIVTITNSEDNDDATDCLMYWADENGKPLEGYTALAKFKLDGEVTKHEMYTHTIIPEGAKKLIAYAYNGLETSSEYVSVDLPDNCAYKLTDDYDVEFQIISDVHVTTPEGAINEVRLSNQHFRQMLEDVKENSPDSMGIFINGDIANTGSEAEFKMVYSMYTESQAAGNGKLPEIHMSIGNHDWIKGNPDSQFQKYVKILNPKLKEQPENVYYDEVVNGYHFIYLGGEQAGLHAVMSKEQLEWFDGLMAKYTKEDPDKPIFLFLHQSMYNTVAGSLPGQGWDGVANEKAFKEVLKKYGQIILVNGHSHWELNSISCMYPGDDEIPVALNTAAVGYLWSSYNILGGEFADGSHGYNVRVYDDKVVFIGRDYENNLDIPSAIFILKTNDVVTDAEEYEVALGSDAVNIGAKTTDGGFLNYYSLNPDVATVSSDGTVIPHGLGEAEIEITAYGTDTTVMSRKRVKVIVNEISVARVAGDTRFDNSIKNADLLKSQLGVEKFENVILASGLDFADALAGIYLAYVKNAPILITADLFSGKPVYEDINAYIKENLAEDGTVYVLGGKKAVSEEAVEDLKDFKVERLAGATRFETNLEILKAAEVTDEDMIVSTAKNYADSLSAAAVKRPILLVGESLRDDQKKYLDSLKTKTYYIIGGTKAVSSSVQYEIRKYGRTKRIAGGTRHETSVLIAEEFFNGTNDKVVLAYSYNYPDGLCSGPLAANLNAPIILTRIGDEGTAADYCKKHDIHKGIIMGGQTVMPGSAIAIILQLSADIEI